MSEDEFGIWAARELERAIDEIGEDKIGGFHCRTDPGRGRRHHSARDILA
jgi:putrescine aminotransferase